MSLALEILRSLPLAELRRLVAIKENQRQLEALMHKRDTLLEECRMIQKQIDELISIGLSHSRRKRTGPSVKALCKEVLQGKKHGLTPAQVKNDILKKYPHRNNRTFYNQVFIALTRNEIFRKLKNGKFVLPEKNVSKRASRRRRKIS